MGVLVLTDFCRPPNYPNPRPYRNPYQHAIFSQSNSADPASNDLAYFVTFEGLVSFEFISRFGDRLPTIAVIEPLAKLVQQSLQHR
jgi:hypothetical protein